MEITKECILLSATSIPYEFNNISGVSHKIRVSVSGEIYPLKATSDQVQDNQNNVGRSGILIFKLSSIKERLSLSFVSFEEEV